jgi:transposase
MARACVRLTDSQRRQIDTLHKDGLSNRAIAKKVHKASSVVDYYIKYTKNRTVKKKPGRKPIVTNRLTRTVLREASLTGASTTSIKRKLGLSLSKSTVFRIIRDCPHLKCAKRKKKPPISEDNKARRLVWARDRMHWTEQWKKIIWTDEKKFNSDGPDGYGYYWHDIRKEEEYLSRRYQGGPSVMVWTGFGTVGKCNIAILTRKVNALKYQEALEHHFLPFRNNLNGKEVVFQQDNAPIHTANSTKQWLTDHHIVQLPWPAYSPDLNPMENVWGILVRHVYADGKQYNSQQELKTAIIEAWNQVTMEKLNHFVDSMPERIFNVIQHNGSSTKY